MKKNLLQLCYVFKHDELTHIIRIMRLSVFFVFVLFFQLHAVNMHSQEARITITKNNLSFGELITEIERQTDYLFLYGDKDINLSQPVRVDAKNKTVKEILDDVLANKGLTYKVLDNYISLHSTKNKRSISYSESPADTPQVPVIKVTGTVVDQLNTPIIGANVLLRGSTSTGTVTDIDGHFSIEVPANAHLVFSYIGYKNKDIAVNNQKTLLISLEEDSKNLEEVVVTALGIKRSEKALGYSVQKVGGNSVTEVKGVDITTSLTGKIAGLNIRNTTDFFTESTILLRGVTPLIVIDGSPSRNIRISDLAADDIASFEILKGGAASSLYGESGRNGVIMITTKRAKDKGVNIAVNSNTMFHCGFLRIPEAQSDYSSGIGGVYDAYDEVWGDKLDIGRTAKQWDPINQEWKEMPLESRGKNNFNNFLENSFVTNNNINVNYKGEKGSFRSSVNHIYNKGVFPNNTQHRFNFTLAGDAKLAEKLTVDASMTFNKRTTPQTRGAGYGNNGYIYNLLVWTGPDYNLLDFKNYWIEGKEQIEQNWHYSTWYNNPYLLAYETTKSSNQDRLFGQFNLNYEPTNWLKTIARIGYNNYSTSEEIRYPVSHRSQRKGYFEVTEDKGYNINGDLIGLVDFKFGDLSLNGLFGGTINYRETKYLDSETLGGLLVPGFYSLSSGADGVGSYRSITRYQTNSLYGKISIGWKNMLFAEATGRNDWSSTLDKSERSYFYPSISGSFIISEALKLPECISYWKVRGSWAMSKTTPSYNDINPSYTINTNIWDAQNGASLPSSLRPSTLKPEMQKDWEVGTNLHFLNNRLQLDVAYYEKTTQDRLYNPKIPAASGYTSTWVNMDEKRINKGWEITISGEPVKTKDFIWTSSINWSRDRLSYKKIDPAYADDYLWVHNGAPINLYVAADWERDPEGNLILSNGMPILSKYMKNFGSMDPDWIWGFTNHFTYKNFNLSISLDGRIGGIGWDQTTQAMWHTGASKGTVNQWRYDEVVNKEKTFIAEGVKVVSGSVNYDSYGRIISDTRVFAPNDVAVSYESFTKTYNIQPSNEPSAQWIDDMTFIKLREISLGYNLPKNICEKIKLNNLEVSLVGQNLFMWSKNFKNSDPDGTYDTAEFITPSVRYMGFNIKFDF